MTAWSAEWIALRKQLVENLAAANDAFDSTLIKLSGGALGISFVFVRQFVGDSEPQAVYLLGAAWMLWLLSLTCCLWSHATSGLTMEKAIRRGDAGDIPDGGGYNTATLGLNIGGGVCFVVATFLAAVFMILNLGG